MKFSPQESFQFGTWTVEPLRGSITGDDGSARHLEPKVMEVFVCLARRPNELVTRQELLDSVWTDHVAADELLTGAISDLRRALEDSDDTRYIETVPKRGYRLVGQVRVSDPVGVRRGHRQHIGIGRRERRVAICVHFAGIIGCGSDEDSEI